MRQSGNCRWRHCRKRSRYLRRVPRRAASRFAPRSRSSIVNGPVRPPKRSTSSSRRPERSSFTRSTRRTRLRVSFQHSTVSALPRSASTKVSRDTASRSSPGSIRTGFVADLRKRSIARDASRGSERGSFPDTGCNGSIMAQDRAARKASRAASGPRGRNAGFARGAERRSACRPGGRHCHSTRVILVSTSRRNLP